MQFPLGQTSPAQYRFIMSQTETDILNALLELERTVASLPAANPKPDLRGMFKRIDDLAATLPGHTDELLLHYLRKKSYQKARLFLEGRDAENAAGNCHGHVE
jgi:hypothetical protein